MPGYRFKRPAEFLMNVLIICFSVRDCKVGKQGDGSPQSARPGNVMQFNGNCPAQGWTSLVCGPLRPVFRIRGVLRHESVRPPMFVMTCPGSSKSPILAQFLNEDSGNRTRSSMALAQSDTGRPSKKSTTPVSSEYSAPTTRSWPRSISCSRTWDPCRN